VYHASPIKPNQEGSHAVTSYGSVRRSRWSFPATAPALAATAQPFNDAVFVEAQRAGKPIFVAIHASWCPICKAQTPILAQLMADPKFKDLVYLTIDFDSQKDLVRRFGARMQSTLISFKGATEQARSVGDTNRQSIAALLNKVL
jgi:thioredoxin 1